MCPGQVVPSPASCGFSEGSWRDVEDQEARIVPTKETEKGLKGKKVSSGVRSVCHHGVINTPFCRSKGGRADGASKH
ncbi:hypothetical protein EYF80_009513 [Liparis tanakae]|uniref:Uncharacterized protein n=1 Tax=Liparis tanakae TaxID=230148 RepID=A0A4Z2IRF2_9TELE|nr:hypothetical protein EYF80_009513 [Liparis tanakae]